ncbi:MAG TPA: biotin--[acetyl-CoA-carboxylase] ligase [Nitrososphaerales archaeon]|nr:biotin--[acetyl-CoA-carboxylase] ligase [Nitrososphaerales archaeon]
MKRNARRESALNTRLLGMSFSKLISLKPFCVDSTSSTQDYIVQIPRIREGFFVVSRVQDKGRGRLGRTWISDDGGLYLSLALEPNSKITDKITKMCSESIVETLKNFSLDCSIKDPNDVICNRKKIAGVLVDAILEGKKNLSFAGIGVNLNNGPGWSAEMLSIATSFKLERREIDIDEFLLALLANLDQNYARLDPVP